MINLRMSSFTYGPITIEEMVPAEFSNLVLPGGEAAYAEGDFGKMLLQEIQLRELTINYSIMKIREDLALDFSSQPGNMQIHAALKNDFHCFIKGLGDLCLAEGEYNVLDAKHLEGTRYLEKNEEYRSFHVVAAPEMLETLVAAFPPMEEWINGIDASETRLLFKNNNPLLNTHLKDIIERVIHSPYIGEIKKLYMEIKLREFMFLCLVPLGKDPQPAVKLSRRNVELIQESKLILEKVFDQHITINDIAKELGINEFKLKTGFKKLFGITMFEYLMETKMQKARELLLQTDKPIKEIAVMTGYSTKQSFLNAFKKYFHNTPGAFRKN